MLTFSPPVTEPRTLSSVEVEGYAKNGFLLRRGLLNADALATLRGVYARAHKRALVHGRSFRDGKAFYELEPVASAEGGRTPLLRKVQEIHLVDDAYREVFESDAVLDVVADLIGPTIYYHSSKLMCKPPRGGRRKPWHQDWAYWPDMDPRQVTVWAAIDAATRGNGCIQALPGSHLRGALPHYQREDYMIDEDNIDPGEVFYAEMQPGDVLLFDVLLLHSSDPNLSEKARLAGIVDYEAQAGPPGHVYGSSQPIRRS